MASLTSAFGSSHTPMLNSPAEDFPRHAAIDRSDRVLVDKDGNARTYAELERMASPNIAREIAIDVLQAKAARCQAGIRHVASSVANANLDVLIVVGDDQREQFLDDNMPAVSIYWGGEIQNGTLPLPESAPPFWKQARSQYHEPERPRSYPVDSALAAHLIDSLMDCDFDVSASKKLRFDSGEGHAFGFVHRRLMTEEPIPIVPVLLNTYYPPNQPRPARCCSLGRAIRAAIETWPRRCNVGVLASGGLSHFVVDEQLDRQVLKACCEKDVETLERIQPSKLRSGSSEIRNWIVTAAAAEHLDVIWHDYVPCYRSTAGTGTGIAFAVWDKPT